jgi:hypothetical protein
MIRECSVCEALRLASAKAKFEHSGVQSQQAVNNVPRVQQASFASILPRYAIHKDSFQPKGPVWFMGKAEENEIVRDRRRPDRRQPKVLELALRSSVR